jgi:hypothetical protein
MTMLISFRVTPDCQIPARLFVYTPSVVRVLAFGNTPEFHVKDVINERI